MGLPAAVVKANEEADRLLKEQGAKKEEEVVLNIDPKLLKKDDDDDTINIDPNNLDNFDGKKKDLDEPAKIIQKAPEKDEAAEKIKELEAMIKKLDNENRTLKIKRNDHDRTVSELKTEVINLKAEAVNLKAELIKKETPAQDPVSHKFSDDERQVFVDEGLSDKTIEILEKRGVQPASQVDNSRIEVLEQKIASAENETLEEKNIRFWSELDIAAPQWDSLNEDPGFTAYLSTFPPYSDKNLGMIMQDAQKRFDVTKIAQIFNDYKADDGAANLDDPNKNINKDIPKKETPNLADLATPKSSNSAPPKPKPGKWTTAETTKFYNDVVRNPGKYTDAQILAIEKKYVYPQ